MPFYVKKLFPISVILIREIVARSKIQQPQLTYKLLQELLGEIIIFFRVDSPEGKACLNMSAEGLQIC